ncbi:pseudouridine 5'-phosphatase [Malassezia sp. CBS 17886]|nr:pseudouridine 5'-phosphatase [Malassezia sp. CBS 17886]
MTADDTLGCVRAVLFDMDGLLIDSESIYTDVVNEVLRPYGKQQSWEIKSRLMGKPEREATLTLLSSLWPPNRADPEDVARGFGADCPLTLDEFLTQRNGRLLPAFEHVRPMPGAMRLVQHLHKHKIPMCIATGSKRRNYEIKAGANADLFAGFEGRAVCGDDAATPRGKPHPDIFLAAAKHGLGLQDTEEARAWLARLRDPGAEHDNTLRGAEKEVLVFEDALLVAVAENRLPVNAHQTLASLEEFRPEQWGLPPFEEEGAEGPRAM